VSTLRGRGQGDLIADATTLPNLAPRIFLEVASVTEINRLFEPANPDAKIQRDTCPHNWDSYHLIKAGFDLGKCCRCNQPLSIRAIDFTHVDAEADSASE
jgi:hypothetical protein